MKQDRFLLAILVFIALVVASALVLFFVRQEQGAAYLADDTPEGVIHDYVLAVQNRDVERAYDYLAEMENKPSEPAFTQVILGGYMDTSASIEIGEVQMTAPDEAWATITIHYTSTGIFDRGWDTIDKATLVRQDGAWKLVYMPYPYWSYDWYQPPYEPVKP